MNDLIAFLDEEQRRFVEERLRKGEFPDVESLLRAGIALLQEEEEVDAEKEARFERMIREADEDFAAGRFETVTDIGAWLDGLGRRPNEAA